MYLLIIRLGHKNNEFVEGKSISRAIGRVEGVSPENEDFVGP
jgi:hypothetical protein